MPTSAAKRHTAPAPTIGRKIAIATDAQANVALAYSNGVSGTVELVSRGTGRWTAPRIVGGKSPGRGLAIAPNVAGGWHVIFFSADESALVHTQVRAVGATPPRVIHASSDARLGADAALRVHNDQLFVAYQDATLGTLRYSDATSVGAPFTHRSLNTSGLRRRLQPLGRMEGVLANRDLVSLHGPAGPLRHRRDLAVARPPPRLCSIRV